MDQPMVSCIGNNCSTLLPPADLARKFSDCSLESSRTVLPTSKSRVPTPASACVTSLRHPATPNSANTSRRGSRGRSTNWTTITV